VVIGVNVVKPTIFTSRPMLVRMETNKRASEKKISVLVLSHDVQIEDEGIHVKKVPCNCKNNQIIDC